MDYRVRGIIQARILEWVVFPFSSRSSQPRNWTGVSCIAGEFFTNWAMVGRAEIRHRSTVQDTGFLVRQGWRREQKLTAGHRPGGGGGSLGQACNTRATCICQNMLSPDHSLQRWKNWNPGRRGLPLGPTASQWQPGTWSWLPLAFPTLAAELAPSQPSSSVLESRSISCP